MESGSSKVVRFGVFELDPAARQLRKNGNRIKLQDQPFRVLQLLLERPGEIVPREELKEKLWSDDTFVEFDHSLNTAIQKIRQALRDSAENPRFIETVPRIGYRFVAPVGGFDDTPGRAAALSGWRVWLVGTTIVAVVVAIVAYSLRNTSTTTNLRPEQFRQERLTRYLGDERAPSFSPDGSQVAFSWSQEPNGNSDIWVVVPGTGSPRQITEHPDSEVSPAWSPDGSSVAFLRLPPGSNRVEVWSVSPLGGPERKLGEVQWPRTMDHVLPFGSLLSWSPDGKWLAVSGRTNDEGPLRLQLLSLDTLQTRWLTSPEQSLVGDLMPSFSPDGRAIAFVRRTGVGAGHEPFILRLSADYEPVGEPERIAETMLSSFSPVWTPDGQTVLYLGQRIGQEGIWAVTPASKEQPQLVWPEREARSLAIARRAQNSGFALALDDSDANNDIWSLTIRGPDAGQSRPVVATPLGEGVARYSPRGDKIAYSSHDVNADIWICDSDGRNPRRLTRMRAPVMGWPSWSPDGQSVVFHSRLTGQADIYLADVESGGVRIVAPHAADDAVPVFSPDGGSIYFSSRREGDWAIWRVPPQDGEAVRVSETGVGRPQLSPDGRFLYFYRFREGQICRRPLSNGEPMGPEEVVISLESEVERVYFPVRDGLYFVQWGVLRFFDERRGEIRDVAEMEGSPTSLSPDGTKLLYVKSSGRGRNLLMLTNTNSSSANE